MAITHVPSRMPGLGALILLGLLSAGCTTLPDVKSFADSTAALAAAAGTQYHDISSSTSALRIEKFDVETVDEFNARTKGIPDQQKSIEATGRSLDALFEAMTTYSEKLTSLASAGKSGREAVQSLVTSVKGFEDLAGIAAPEVSSAASAITSAFESFADEITKRQAKVSLADAADAAQPAVDIVAKQFQVIYATVLDNSSAFIRDTAKRQARTAAGNSVIGFNDKVTRNYNTYYQFLNGLVPDVKGAGPDADLWHGFCVKQATPCRPVSELEAVGLVEARMAAIHPIVAAYQLKAADIEAAFEQRRKADAAVVKAVQAWALEHQKLRSSLRDGTPLSAFNLRAALVELEGLLGRK